MKAVRTLPRFEQTAALGEQVATSGQLLACFDFDGTLAPIVDRPDSAWLPAKTREALESLAHAPGVTVALVSGRSVDDLRLRAALDSAVYAGNHGLQIDGGPWQYLSPEAEQARDTLEKIGTALRGRLSPMPGVLVEPKGLTTSIHFRLASREDAGRVPQIVVDLVRPFGERFRLTSGKEVVEVRPAVDWHKGKAILWLAARLGDPLVVFAGDDVTDEDAFASLPRGLTVKVGAPGATHARYWVDGPPAVAELIRWLDRLRRERK